MAYDTAELKRLGTEYLDLRNSYEAARDQLTPEIVRAIKGGVQQVEIARLTGMTRERIRQIARSNGVKSE